MSRSKSFVLSRFPVPESVFHSALSQLSQLDEAQQKFVLHVLVSNVLNLNKMHTRGLEGWIELGVELPCQWIAEHFGSKFKASSIDPRILTFRNYSTGKHECRSFVAAQSLLDVVLGWSPKDISEAADEPVVNLFDGSPYEVFAPKEWEHGVYSSKAIGDAIKVFDGCPFNYSALADHLSAAQDRVRLTSSQQERARMERAFRNDNGCATRIRAGCVVDDSGLASYKPEYRTIYTGRIVEVGGGSQSCSRGMKAAMFKDLAGLRNYDLKRAQAYILLQELEDAGLPRAWIETYVHASNANEERSAALGISKDAYKTCLYATIMGARHMKNWRKDANKIYERLIDDCGGNESKAKDRALGVFAALAPLKAEVDAWHKHLTQSTACCRVDPSRKRVRTLKNACGQHFPLEGEHADRLERRAAAFILQGQEAAFVHRLTALGRDNGFVPISNQHDGLVVIGEIPESVVDQAAKQSGLRYATMDPKPFL